MSLKQLIDAGIIKAGAHRLFISYMSNVRLSANPAAAHASCLSSCLRRCLDALDASLCGEGTNVRLPCLQDYRAELRPDGTILWEGRPFNSPSAWSIFVKRQARAASRSRQFFPTPSLALAPRLS